MTCREFQETLRTLSRINRCTAGCADEISRVESLSVACEIAQAGNFRFDGGFMFWMNRGVPY